MARRSLEERERNLTLLRNKCEDIWAKYFDDDPHALPPDQMKRQCIELRRAIEPIIELQTKLAGETLTPPYNPQEALNKFLQWANRMGIETGKVEPVYDEINEEFLLRAYQPIDPYTVLVSVPRKAVLSFDLVRKSKLLKRCFERDPLVSTGEQIAMSLYLCCQKLTPGSNWELYFDMLPRRFETPLYFTDEELESIHPSAVQDNAYASFRSLIRQWIHFLCESFLATEWLKVPARRRWEPAPVLSNTPIKPTNLTFDLYRWCMACVIARINAIPSEEPEADGTVLDAPCLFPMLDMAVQEADYCRMAPEPLYVSADDTVSITSMRTYEPGELITVEKGRRSTGAYFVHCGYLPDVRVEDDTCKIRFGFAAKNKEQRIAMMDNFEKGYPAENVYYFELRGLEPSLPRELVYFARIHVLENPDPNNMSALEDPAVITKAWKFLQQRMELMIRALGNLEPLESHTERQKRILKLKSHERKLFEVSLSNSKNALSRIERGEPPAYKDVVEVADVPDVETATIAVQTDTTQTATGGSDMLKDKPEAPRVSLETIESGSESSDEFPPLVAPATREGGSNTNQRGSALGTGIKKGKTEAAAGKPKSK